MNKKKISLVLGITCFLLTIGIAIQVNTISNTGSTVSTNEKENKLKDEILRLKEKYDNLYRELEQTEEELETQRVIATQNNGELETIESSIKENNKLLGLTEVTGSGITVILRDNNTWTNYIGDPNNLLVHYSDILEVINELKNAGAEAISINGQRIVTTSSIECDGSVIKINGEKIGTPFEIKAIGYPEQLVGAVYRKGGYLRNLEEDYGIEVSITKSEKITIPKYSGVIKFNYATNKK